MRHLAPAAVFLALAACNQPPAGGELVIAPENPTSADDLLADLIEPIKDENDDIVSLRWTWYLHGAVEPAHTTDTVPSEVTRKGQVWRIEIIPNDGKTDGVMLFAETLILNTKPVATVELTPTEPLADEALTATVQVSDGDLDDTSGTRITWLVDGTATDVPGTTVDPSLTSRGETWRIEVVPYDGEEDGETASAEVVIGNVAPVADGVVVDPTEAYEQTRLTARATGSDHDDDTLDWTYTWYVEGGEVKSGAEDWLDGTSFSKGEGVMVEATASDGFEDSNAVTSDTITILNTAPSITGARLDPVDATEGSTLTCLPEGAFDVDGDTVNYIYAWTVGGRSIGATTATIDGDSFNKGQEVVCTVTPTDGTDNGEPVSTKAVTIGNTAPSLTSASINPATPRTDDTLTATGGGITDVDGDTVTLLTEWFVNKSSVSKGATLDGTAFKRGDSVEVELTPYDGDDTGTAVRSKAVTVANTPPKILSVSISPTVAYTDSSVRAAISAVDADGDKLSTTWSWTVNGTTQSEVSSTLTGDKFKKGDRVQAWATVSDGTDKTGPTGSNVVTVRNTAPTSPAIAISPGAPDDADDLICRVTKAATDKDKDKLAYTFTWTRNSATWTGSTSTTIYKGDTILDASLKPGDKWYCSVVVSDGDTKTTKVNSGTVTIKPSSTCGNRVRDSGEEYDPAPGPFKNVRVDAGTCRWDFSKVEQLYCNGSCSWAGSSSCDKADADVFCKLKTDNKRSTATSYRIGTALAKPGFPCSPHGTYGTKIFTDRGVKAGSRDPTWQDTSILANHGSGRVIVNVVCTNP